MITDRFPYSPTFLMIEPTCSSEMSESPHLGHGQYPKTSHRSDYHEHLKSYTLHMISTLRMRNVYISNNQWYSFLSGSVDWWNQYCGVVSMGISSVSILCQGLLALCNEFCNHAYFLLDAFNSGKNSGKYWVYPVLINI